MPDDAGGRGRLLGLRLAALARDHLDAPGLETSAVPGGVVGRAGTTLAAMVDGTADADAVALTAAALVLAERWAATTVHLLAEAPAAGLLARLGALLAEPPRSWSVDGRGIEPARPSPVPSPPRTPPELAALADEMRVAGAEPLAQHGMVVGEVEGLEVARAVIDPGTGEARLEVGVGAVDQEAWASLGEVAGRPPGAADLARIVELVRRHRPGDGSHPFARLAPEGAMRARLVREPELIGADVLVPVPTPRPRPNLRTPWPAAAAGTSRAGGDLAVTCSVGIHPAAVVTAAELAHLHGPSARPVLAVPGRDRHPLLLGLAARWERPVDVVAVG